MRSPSSAEATRQLQPMTASADMGEAAAPTEAVAGTERELEAWIQGRDNSEEGQLAKTAFEDARLLFGQLQ